MNQQPQLSIVIVNHFAEKILPECLSSIAASDHSAVTEIIIVDNPPIENNSVMKILDSPDIKRIPAPGRIGFGRACNLGVSQAAGEILLFLNPDVILDKSAIGILLSVMKRSNKCVIAVGRLSDPDGGFQPSCRRFPSPGNLFVSRGSIPGRLFRGKINSYTLPDYDEITEVEAAAAAMMMISRDDFESLSGFDERFFMYMEDTDLCYRAAKRGISVFYVPQAMGKHYWGYSTGRYRFRRIIWHHRSIWKYFRIHRRRRSTLFILAPLLLSNCFLSLIVELFTLRR